MKTFEFTVQDVDNYIEWTAGTIDGIKKHDQWNLKLGPYRISALADAYRELSGTDKIAEKASLNWAKFLNDFGFSEGDF